MNGTAVTPSPALSTPTTTNGGASGGANRNSEAGLNSLRIGMVAKKLEMYTKPSGQRDEAVAFYQLCLSLARELDMIVADAQQKSEDSLSQAQQRGIDYAVANNEVPSEASYLPPVLKQVCRRRNEFVLQSAIMVLMISVKNACKLGWFSTKDTDELLKLANEVGSKFGTMGELNSEAASLLPIVSEIMSRYYPQLKLGQVMASLEVKPGYGTYAVDFHIPKNVSYTSGEKLRLFVARKDNMYTSTCIISPQQVNLLLNGKGVDPRTNVIMDPGPQLPTVVDHLLKYGTNLLQAVGQFNGHYIIIVAFMSKTPTSTLPAPQDYVQHDSTALSSGSDSEIIEGPSRISLNCPISYSRIRIPVKGHLCKHYQCFDLSNYLEINSKRPSWRCPHCNQSVCFTDIRVDRNMVKVLKEVGENVSEVTISVDGSWTAAPSDNRKDESRNKNLANQQDGPAPQDSSVNGHPSDAPCKVYDLTKEEDEMDVDRCGPVDTKPVIHHSIQGQPITTSTYSTLPPTPRCTSDFNQYSSTQVANCTPTRTLYNFGTGRHSLRQDAQNVCGISGALTGNCGLSPVLTDAVSPALSRQPDSFRGINYPTCSTSPGQLSTSHSLQLQEAVHPQSNMSSDFGRPYLIPRNVTRDPSAIQALPVQMPTPIPQQHSRPAVGVPAASGSSVPFHSNALVTGTVVSHTERQRHLQQSHINRMNLSNMGITSVQNRPTSQVMGLSTPTQLFNSVPPHMRSSRSPIQQAVSPGGIGNTPSTVQRVQLMPQQAAQMRQPQTMPLQMQSPRNTTSLPLGTGSVPQAVTRTENLIDLQAQKEWTPSGVMRGSLTGQDLAAALSRHMGPATQPAQTLSHRPPVSVAANPHLQVLLANRMNARGSPQVPNRPTTVAANVTGVAGTQPEGPRGVN